MKTTTEKHFLKGTPSATQTSGAGTADRRRCLSSKKLEANRRNAKLSTGARTEAGKNHSRRNALKHGVLASAVLITEGDGAEDATRFQEFLRELSRDLAPVGKLEETLVEKVAVCYWRQQRALRCEAGLIKRSFLQRPEHALEESMRRSLGFSTNPESSAIKNHLSLPLGSDLDCILRYETTIQRQLVYTINQLERLQRARKGEDVPVPVSVQLSSYQESDQ